MDEEMEDVDRELLDNEDSEEDAEAEEEDEEDEDDEEIEALPPPPIIKQERQPGMIKPNVTVTAPPEEPIKSVEDKEMEDEEDEELSELDSNENDEDDDEDDDSDDDDDDGSRDATPDLSKLTRRQRGHYEDADANLLALSNEAQKKKHLTAEEHAMRRAEMARRRKNLSEKRNEEEKVSLQFLNPPKLFATSLIN
jgi:Ino eighty subunit 2